MKTRAGRLYIFSCSPLSVETDGACGMRHNQSEGKSLSAEICDGYLHAVTTFLQAVSQFNCVLTIQTRSDDQVCSTPSYLRWYDERLLPHYHNVGNVTNDKWLAAGTSLSLSYRTPRLITLHCRAFLPSDRACLQAMHHHMRDELA